MNFDTYNNAEYLMTANNMACGLNMPPALKTMKHGDLEIAHGLPPNAPRRAFLVDEYPACPANWMRSKGRTKSYFVPIKTGHGLWLDFNMSLSRVAQDVAIVISAQGINAITGLPTGDSALEKYQDRCPKHKVDFGPDRLCPECKHKWPGQNFLSSAAQPRGLLWLDGFRAEDGVIRQYVFTEDKARGVAAAIIGEDRVFALGISYYLSKTQRAQDTVISRPLMGQHYIASLDDTAIGCADVAPSASLNSFTSWSSSVNSAAGQLMDTSSCEKGITAQPSFTKSATKGSSLGKGQQGMLSKRLAQDAAEGKGSLLGAPPTKGRLMAATHDAHQVYCCNTIDVKKVEIAAGAKVNQHIYDDPNSLDYWQAEPTALIVINYCTEEDAERIIAAGKKDLSGNPEGFLAQVPSVGNP